MPEGPTVDDIALLDAWCQGDRSAGDELFERYYPSVARFFHRKVSEAAREDLIQETFLACTTCAPRFRGEARFRTYLYAIAHNILASHLRRLGRNRSRLGSEVDVEEMPAESFGPSPVATVAQHEEKGLLLEAMQRIPRTHQVVLELHYWEDLTVAEIGELLGVPLGTAKTRIRNGRAYLEDLLPDLARSSGAPQSSLRRG